MRLFSLKMNLLCCSSKEILFKQDMAEICLMDYCRVSDKKKNSSCIFHIQTMKLSFAASVHRCGIVKLQENAWQTVSSTIFRDK